MSVTMLFVPVRGSCSRISPVRAECRTRPSGSTARLIGSPGRSFRVTFWKCDWSGNSWAVAVADNAHIVPTAATHAPNALPTT